MSRGKYLRLEEARNQGKIKQFAKEHPAQGDGAGGYYLRANIKDPLFTPV